jgi:hypothetical protein
VGEVPDHHHVAGLQRAGLGHLVAELDLVDVAGAGVDRGGGHRPVVAAQADPVGRVVGSQRDREAAKPAKEVVDVLGGQQQLEAQGPDPPMNYVMIGVA